MIFKWCLSNNHHGDMMGILQDILGPYHEHKRSFFLGEEGAEEQRLYPYSLFKWGTTELLRVSQAHDSYWLRGILWDILLEFLDIFYRESQKAHGLPTGCSCHWHFLATRPRKKGWLRPGNCNLRCENQGAKGFFHGLDAASPSKVEGCSICLEDMAVASEAVRLPCGHCYHPRCLKNWFVRKLRCPLCNVAVEWVERDNSDICSAKRQLLVTFWVRWIFKYSSSPFLNWGWRNASVRVERWTRTRPHKDGANLRRNGDLGRRNGTGESMVPVFVGNALETLGPLFRSGPVW